MLFCTFVVCYAEAFAFGSKECQAVIGKGVFIGIPVWVGRGARFQVKYGA